MSRMGVPSKRSTPRTVKMPVHKEGLVESQIWMMTWKLSRIDCLWKWIRIQHFELFSIWHFRDSNFTKLSSNPSCRPPWRVWLRIGSSCLACAATSSQKPVNAHKIFILIGIVQAPPNAATTWMYFSSTYFLNDILHTPCFLSPRGGLTIGFQPVFKCMKAMTQMYSNL